MSVPAELQVKAENDVAAQPVSGYEGPDGTRHLGVRLFVEDGAGNPKAFTDQDFVLSLPDPEKLFGTANVAVALANGANYIAGLAGPIHDVREYDRIFGHFVPSTPGTLVFQWSDDPAGGYWFQHDIYAEVFAAGVGNGINTNVYGDWCRILYTSTGAGTYTGGARGLRG